MGNYTEKLNLYKVDPVVDKDKTFNVKTMLNDNWDKIDNFSKDVNEIKNKFDAHLNEGAKVFYGKMEPIKSSDNIYWIQEVGENYFVPNSDGVVLANAGFSDDKDIKFEQII